jgi:hypothetical protein
MTAGKIAQILDELAGVFLTAAPSKTRDRDRRPPPGRPARSSTYRACSIKRRTKAEIDVVKLEIEAVLRDDNLMTVRQVFYQLVVRGTIEKTERAYQGTVIRLLTEMRLSGEIPFAWIVDESRRRRETQTYDNISDAVRDTARFYRRSALREASDHAEIWSEKEALAGLIWDVASDYDVPVIVSKGMPSLTQLYGTAVEIRRAAKAGKFTHIYQFGDHDPSGVLIPETIARRLEQLCERLNCPAPDVERVALTEQQIAEFNLPSRPTKREGNAHARDFIGDSTELDALPARALRDMVRKCVERHIGAGQLEALRAAEASERELLNRWATRTERAVQRGKKP